MSYSIAAVPQVRTYRLAQVYRTVYAYVADSRLYRSTPIRAAQRPWESLFLLRRLLLLLLSSYRFVNLYSSVRVGHWETGFDPRRECQVDLVIRENKGEARPTGFSTLRGPSFRFVSFLFSSSRPSFTEAVLLFYRVQFLSPPYRRECTSIYITDIRAPICSGLSSILVLSFLFSPFFLVVPFSFFSFLAPP